MAGDTNNRAICEILQEVARENYAPKIWKNRRKFFPEILGTQHDFIRDFWGPYK